MLNLDLPPSTFLVGNLKITVQNIFHGDIEPENLLVGSDGTVKIFDFSVSRMFEVRKLLSECTFLSDSECVLNMTSQTTPFHSYRQLQMPTVDYC